jgi:predicted RNA-binding protein YlxR (DUF448 family)
MKKIRKIPQRTCVGCQTVKPKRELIRVVRTPDGHTDVDPTGKRSGRGAYLCPNTDCLEKALKGRRLENALDCGIDGEVIIRLRQRLNELTRPALD